MNRIPSFVKTVSKSDFDTKDRRLIEILDSLGTDLSTNRNQIATLECGPPSFRDWWRFYLAFVCHHV